VPEGQPQTWDGQSAISEEAFTNMTADQQAAYLAQWQQWEAYYAQQQHYDPNAYQQQAGYYMDPSAGAAAGYDANAYQQQAYAASTQAGVSVTDDTSSLAASCISLSF
jgi:hypothetical protein